MAQRDRNELKQYFKKGELPTEDKFRDLIESSVNIRDDGFEKTPEDGFKISLSNNDNPDKKVSRLISIFKSLSGKDAVWSIEYDKAENQLLISNPDITKPAMSFSTGEQSGSRHSVKTDSGENGEKAKKAEKAEKADNSEKAGFSENANNGDKTESRIGVNKTSPNYTLDVNGVMAAKGVIGTYGDNKSLIPADGDWYSITGPLTGCHAFDVMAGVGEKGVGRYALVKAIAINTFNPSGLLSNFLSLKKKIKIYQSYYLSRNYRIKFRWHKKGDYYFLQMKTKCAYGSGVRIQYYITNLWFDHDMSQSQNMTDDKRK